MAVQAIRTKSIAKIGQDDQPESTHATSLYNQNSDLNQALKIMTSGPIKVTDEESAKQRIDQWVAQKDQSRKVELATKAYKFYHRMSLIYIYEDMHVLAVKKHPRDEEKQRRFERDIVCSQQGIHARTERRQKNSAVKIRCLISAGITFDQMAKVGLNVSDFEVANKYYNEFLKSVKLNIIGDLYRKFINPSPLLEPTSVQPLTPHALFSKLSNSISKIELSKQNDLEQNSSQDESSDDQENESN